MAVTESRALLIEATPEQIMAVLLDLESLPSWSSSHKSVEVIERDELGRPRTSRQVVKVAGVSDEQELEYTVYDDGVGWTLAKSGQQRAQTGRYTFIPAGESTRVHFELTVDLAIPLPGFVVKRGAKGLMETATAGLRKRVLELGDN